MLLTAQSASLQGTDSGEGEPGQADLAEFRAQFSTDPQMTGMILSTARSNLVAIFLYGSKWKESPNLSSWI